MIRVGIVGATGYAGAELVRLLLSHPAAQIVWYGSKSYAGQRYADVFRHFEGRVDDLCKEDDMDRMSETCDVIFTATPQGYCAGAMNDDILSKTKVIDLSADFRLKDVAVYEQWYGITHLTPQYLKEAVYGLCEINRREIAGARLIANPGCYTTCSILTAYPAVKEGLIDADAIIVDALSGVSGAGRSAKTDYLFCEVNESARPYGVASHRHTPEIEEQLSAAADRPLTITFTPHLVPMNRGILATVYAPLKEGVSERDVREVYHAYYGEERFIRLLGPKVYPDTRFVENSNLLDIAVKTDTRTNRLIMMGALDNLVKGAAGQAVQNMNLLFDLEEDSGLSALPQFP